MNNKEIYFKVVPYHDLYTKYNPDGECEGEIYYATFSHIIDFIDNTSNALLEIIVNGAPKVIPNSFEMKTNKITIVGKHDLYNGRTILKFGLDAKLPILIDNACKYGKIKFLDEIQHIPYNCAAVVYNNYHFELACRNMSYESMKWLSVNCNINYMSKQVKLYAIYHDIVCLFEWFDKMNYNIDLNDCDIEYAIKSNSVNVMTWFWNNQKECTYRFIFMDDFIKLAISCKYMNMAKLLKEFAGDKNNESVVKHKNSFNRFVQLLR
jgi:hypothetical protein